MRPLTHLACLFLLVALPALGSGYPVSEIRHVPSNGSNVSPQVTTTGDGFLVTWADDRSALVARVARDGTLLDRPSVRLAASRSFATARDGDRHLIAWIDDAGVSLGTISPDRLEIESPVRHFAVDSGLREGTARMALVASGSSHLVAFDHWVESRSEVVALVVGRDGRLLASRSFDSDRGLTAAVWDGTTFVLFLGPRLVRVSPSGDVPDATAIDLGVDVLAAVRDGQGIFIAGNQGGAMATGRVSGNGIWLLPPCPAGASEAAGAALGFDGREVQLLWRPAAGYEGSSTSIPVRMIRFDSSGSMRDQHVLVEEADRVSFHVFQSPGMSVASDGERFLLAWSQGSSHVQGSERDVVVGILESGAPLASVAPFPVSTRAADQQFPKLARSGSNALVTWTESHPAVRPARAMPDMRASILTPAGRVVAELDLEQVTFSNDSPAVAWDGENTWLVWPERGVNGEATLLGMRIDPRGRRIDEPFVIASVGWNPRLWCRSDGLCLVLFDSPEPRIARIADGLALDRDGRQMSVRPLVLASDGSDLLMVSLEGAPSIAGSILTRTVVHATRETLELDTADIAASPTSYLGIAATWDGSRYLVVWEDHPLGGRPVTLRGSFLARDGASLDGDSTGWRGFEIIEDAWIVSLFHDGTHFHLTTQTDEKASVRLGPDGRVIDDLGLVLTRQALRLPSGGIFDVLTERLQDREHLDAMRVRLRSHPQRRRSVRPDR